MRIESRPCSECAAWMVRRPTGVVLPTSPPRFPTEWWCACGHREPADVELGKTMDEESYGWWQAVNRQRQHEEREAVRAQRGFWRRLWDWLRCTE
jgi:hypothetical protein